MAKFGNKEGTWVFLGPIRGLELTYSVSNEYKVEKITFFSARKLPYIRKRLGLPRPISELKKRIPGHLDRFFDSSDTFAWMRTTGSLDEQQAKFTKLVRDELAILSLSQLGYDRRKSNASPELANYQSPEASRFLAVCIEDEFLNLGGETTGKIGNLRLDSGWLTFQQQSFFSTCCG